ncbi:hypothetical protein [Ralstonia phage RP31]|uniref:Uncharacterized protein n=2 Tax=Ripduovirus RP12 TaxID=2560700 RepID=A0A1L7N111_9CAUD|nr:hypothetical protein FDH28_gp224 [Ralstonia phage RP12]BAW19171.1 hypothetical protein [Ralstonia phage RP12]BAW19457.1 hypothetical protein [Ralstonia phage RP31]
MSYDTVVFTCPCCSKTTSEQIGNGNYANYTLETAPDDILKVLCSHERKVYCEQCNERIAFTSKVKVVVTPKKWEEIDYEPLMEHLRKAGVIGPDTSVEEALSMPSVKIMLELAAANKI